LAQITLNKIHAWFGGTVASITLRQAWELTSEVLSGNTSTRRVFEKSDFRIARSDDPKTVRLVLDLGSAHPA